MAGLTATPPRPKRQTTPKDLKRRTPREPAKRTEEDVLALEEKPESEAERRLRIRANLVHLVASNIREAIISREGSGIEDEWRRAEDLYSGFDDVNMPTRGRISVADKNPDMSTAGPDGAQSRVLINITEPKTDLAVARVKEMLVPTNDRPWDINPTPVPDLEEVTNDPEMAGQEVTLGDGSAAPALAVVEMMKARAQKASDTEQDWIEDKFVQGKVYRELRTVIERSGRLGTGVIKGPFPIAKTKRRWKFDRETRTAQLEVEEVFEPTSCAIRIQDCYPDPACGENIHEGEFFVEREFIGARALRKLAKDPSYDRQAIAQSILEGPMSQAILKSNGTMDRAKPGNTRNEAALHELYHWYGEVSAEALIAMGASDQIVPSNASLHAAGTPELSGNVSTRGGNNIDPEDHELDDPLTPEEEAALKAVPARVTLLNGKIIKATMNPLESGAFPFDFYRWKRIEGQPWGKGVPVTMEHAQRTLTASVRRMLENAGMSAGPQIAMIEGAMTPADGRMEIKGRKLWMFKPTAIINDITKAIQVFNIPSAQEELMNIIRFALEMADHLTGIPMLLHGDQQAGTSPETLGGMKLLVNNALSPLRDHAKDFDDDLTEPHLGRWHDWWMEHGEAEDKGDSEIKALGSTTLIQREEGREFLMMLAPVKDDPGYKIDPAKFSRELAKSNGFDMTTIQYTDDEWKQLQQQKAQQPAPEEPQVQAARIRAEAQAKSDEMRAQNDQLMMNVKRELGMLQIASDERITLHEVEAVLTRAADQMKTDLAKTAMSDRTTREEMNLKLNPANPSGLGI